MWNNKIIIFLPPQFTVQCLNEGKLGNFLRCQQNINKTASFMILKSRIGRKLTILSSHISKKVHTIALHNFVVCILAHEILLFHN